MNLEAWRRNRTSGEERDKESKTWVLESNSLASLGLAHSGIQIPPFRLFHDPLVHHSPLVLLSRLFLKVNQDQCIPTTEFLVISS